MSFEWTKEEDEARRHAALIHATIKNLGMILEERERPLYERILKAVQDADGEDSMAHVELAAAASHLYTPRFHTELRLAILDKFKGDR